jgi:hypothetical protein
MNERFVELAEQAYEQKPLMVLNPETFEIEHKIGNGGVAMYHRVFNQEKFAELIVKECLMIVYERQVLAPTDDDGYFKVALDMVSKDIEQHFGVEE